MKTASGLRRVENAAATLALLVAVACGGQSSAHEGSSDRAGGRGGDTGTGGTSGGGAGVGGTSGAGAGAGGTSGAGAGGTGTSGAGAGSTGTSGSDSGGTAGSAGTGSEPPEPEPLLTLAALARGKSGYVAVGSKYLPDFSDSAGVIFHSADGKSWSKVMSDLPIAPQYLEYGNDRFVVFGSSDETAGAYVSHDGVHWDPGTNPTTYQGLPFAFGNGLFVAQGNNTLYTSVDGVTWNTTGQTVGWAGVAFASDHFVVASTNGSLFGTGETWEPLTITDVLVTNIAVRGYGDHFLGYGANVCCFGELPSTNKYYQLSSTDGATWTTEQVSSLTSLPVLDDGSLCISSSPNHTSTGPDCDHLQPIAGAPHYPHAALKADDVYLIAGDGGVYSSPDGIAWTQVLSDP